MSAVGLAVEPGAAALVREEMPGSASRLPPTGVLTSSSRRRWPRPWTPSRGRPGRPIWSTTPGQPARATCLSTSGCGLAPGASTL